MYKELALVNWEQLTTLPDVDLMCEHFYGKLYECLDRTVPKATVRSDPRGGRIYPDWYTPQIIRDIKLQSKHRAKWLRYNSEFHHEQFRGLRSAVKVAVDRAHDTYIKSVEESLMNDPKRFWGYSTSLRRESPIPTSMSYLGTRVEGQEAIAEQFACFFASVYLRGRTDVSAQGACMHHLGDVLRFSEAEVDRIIRDLTPKHSAGVDLIPGSFVAKSGEVFVKPLTLIFNKSISTGVFPARWKVARLCPIFRNGDKTQIVNYRPIAILCAFSKVYEICLCNVLLSLFLPHLILVQHGFVRRRSTVTNLVVHSQFISSALASGDQVDVIYTDFSKAFDRVDFTLLLAKLRGIGVPGNLLSTLESYLTNRACVVSIGGSTSAPFCPTSGVPQGSNLGPLLFNVFVNDIMRDLKCKSSVYADDAKLMSVIRTPDDALRLQRDLDRFAAWCSTNMLDLNPGKCKKMSFYRGRNPIITSYNIEGTTIEDVTVCRDLGVTFDIRLTFIPHIDNLLASARRTLAFVTRVSRQFHECESY